MNGVNVIDTFEVVVSTSHSFSPLFALIGLVLGIGVGIYINIVIYTKCNKDIGKPLTGLLCIIFGAIGIFIGGNIAPNTEPIEIETRYKVELTKELNYKEFIEQYEVIDFENGYYIVKEKE